MRLRVLFSSHIDEIIIRNRSINYKSLYSICIVKWYTITSKIRLRMYNCFKIFLI